uniref:Chromo domain-containing protein n=2 Tax=Bracon brevicornis TaxID=1563983 RepID=A0A6V7KMA4_9HYME
MIEYANENKGYKYLLTVIDIFSKYAWAIPTKSKTGPEVTSAMKVVLKDSRIPKKLHVDRAKMWKTFSIQGTYKWIDIIDELVADYNNTKHRTIKMKPRDVTLKNEKYLLRHIYGKFEANGTKNVKFKVGDHVRISKYKTVFEKGYTPNWTTEIFKIIKIQNTNPTTYSLEDGNKERVEGAFYQEELAKVKYPDVFLVEKVLKRKGNKEFVKWLGFNSSYNSWIDADKS